MAIIDQVITKCDWNLFGSARTEGAMKAAMNVRQHRRYRWLSLIRLSLKQKLRKRSLQQQSDVAVITSLRHRNII